MKRHETAILDDCVIVSALLQVFGG